MGVYWPRSSKQRKTDAKAAESVEEMNDES